MARPARVLQNALARHVTGQSSTGRVADLTRLYDEKFPKGAALIEPSPTGLRIISPCESIVINCAASDEGRLFRYTDATQRK